MVKLPDLGIATHVRVAVAAAQAKKIEKLSPQVAPHVQAAVGALQAKSQRVQQQTAPHVQVAVEALQAKSSQIHQAAWHVQAALAAVRSDAPRQMRHAAQQGREDAVMRRSAQDRPAPHLVQNRPTLDAPFLRGGDQLAEHGAGRFFAIGMRQKGAEVTIENLPFRASSKGPVRAPESVEDVIRSGVMPVIQRMEADQPGGESGSGSKHSVFKSNRADQPGGESGSGSKYSVFKSKRADYKKEKILKKNRQKAHDKERTTCRGYDVTRADFRKLLPQFGVSVRGQSGKVETTKEVIEKEWPSFFSFLEALDDEALIAERTPFVCAEVNAVALLLLEGVKAESMRFDQIVYGRVRKSIPPCGNCSRWLERAGGTEKQPTFKIRLSVIVGRKTAGPKGYINIFDHLAEKSD